MRTVFIGNVEVGAGMPKVLVPIVARDRAGILEKGEELCRYTMDIVEWRADFYEDVLDIPAAVETGRQLRAVLGDIPILFTFRTKKEGGEREIDMPAYIALNKAMAESGAVDAVDVEIFSGDEVVREIFAAVHAAGKAVVGSNHDFHATPNKVDLLYRFRKMQDLGADISKIAVMPQSRRDVAELLSALAEMAECYADRPFTAMSMGSKGVISRIACEAFGAAMTFGAVGAVSAPGQIPVEKLQTAMTILHDGM